MSRFFRLFTILRIALRYRLDTFFDGKFWPWPVRAGRAVLSLLPDPKANRGERLRMALEDLGPVFIKFGQLLSTRPDLVPADMCSDLSQLQDDVPPFSQDNFIAIVEAALGDSIDNLFLSFDREPLASASVAQVHSAVLHDGREVVVKAIRPRIDRIIEQDTRLLALIARWVERLHPIARRLHPVEVVDDYRNTIFDELDLKREAANTSTLRRNFDDSPLLYVPEVHWHLTNEKVMVTERIYGTPVTDIDALARKNTDFKVLAERGVEIFFTQVFEHNFFHADMHPGNIFVDTGDPARPRYLAVDCAVIGSLSDDDRFYLARNLIAIFRRDYRQVAELHVLSGWVPEGTRLADFEAAIRTVCEPIFERPLREISFAQILVSLFRTAQRFEMEVQPSLVLLQKTLINIEGLGRQLYPDLDLWQTAHPYLEQWLKNRMRPGALADRIKRHGPEWLEQFPQIPQLLYQSLERLGNVDNAIRALQPPPGRKRGTTLTAAALIGAGAALGIDWNDLAASAEPLALLLAGGGILLLLLR